MEFRSVGDLARTLQLQRIGSQQKAAVTRYATELVQGTVRDPLRAPGVSAARLAAAEQRLGQITALRGTLSETASRLNGARLAMERMDTAAGSAATELLSAGSLGNAAMVDAAAESARRALGASVSALNVTVGGETVFGGARTGTAALIGAEDMLGEIEATVVGLTDPDDIAAAVRGWFAPGGGFETTAWLGASPGPGVRLGPGAGDMSAPAPDAADPGLRDTLAGLAMGALLTRSTGLDNTGRQALALEAGALLQSGAEARHNTAARLGRLEADVAAAQSRIATEATTLEIERSEMIGADPFRTASALEEARGQLDLVYTLTARLAKLSLVEYLR